MVEEDQNGIVRLVPEELRAAEIMTLTHAAKVAEERPDDPFVDMRSLGLVLSGDKGLVRNGTVSKTVSRLEKWGYLSVKWEVFDMSTPGKFIRKKFVAITEHGKSKLASSAL